MPDINLKPFEYHRHEHRPVIMTLLGLGLALLGLAAVLQAPWYVYVPIALYLAALVWLTQRYPHMGMRLSVEGWELIGPGGGRMIPLAMIDRVRIGTAAVDIHLSDGTVISVPEDCRPTAAVLKPELDRARIAWEDG